MRETLKTVALVFFGTLLGLALVEIGARLLFDSPTWQSYDEYAAVAPRIPADGVHLYPANTDLIYDINGLYDGADRARFRTSANRFIMPEPAPDSAAQTVLFVGGSTTENAFVDEDYRWVNQLNVPGEIATYNAAMSGIGTVGEYFTFEYLTEQGYRFDLVVLSTMVNDFAWTDRFHKAGYAYRVESYWQGLDAYWRGEYDAFVDTLDPLLRLEKNIRMVGFVRRALPADEDDVTADAPSLTVAGIRQQRERLFAMSAPAAPLATCTEYDQLLMWYEEDLRANLEQFQAAVAATGAEFMVMTEADSYAAPVASFIEDFQYYFTCDGALVQNDDAAQLIQDLSMIYLQVAEDLDIRTFDLAGAMTPLTNGPDGGTYMYDSVHYTQVGAAIVAQTLQPVIRAALNVAGTATE